jgi:RNA polymerase sigma factor (sigma-70 family)
MPTGNLSQFLRRLTRGMTAETLGEQTDRQLIERFLGCRDDSAFEALVRRHGPMVYRVCWRVLQQAEDSEDVFQATFLVLAQRLSTLRKRESLASWLHSVAHRLALNARSQAAARRRHEGHAHVARIVLSDDIPWKEARLVLDAELQQLPEKWRLPLVLCCLEGLTQEEASQQLGWSPRTVLRRLNEARAALGRRLTQRGVVWSAACSAVLLSNCGASAAPPARLIGFIVDAATRVAAGQAARTAVVSAKVAALTQGALKMLVLAKIRITLVCITIGCLVVGAGFVSYQSIVAAQEGESLPALAANKIVAKPKPAPDADKKSFQGTWTVFYMEDQGEPILVEETQSRKLKWIVEGDKYRWGSFSGTFRLDATKKPKTIDITTDDKTVTSNGIYELDGNKLTICMGGANRPKEFATGPGTTAVLKKMEREPPPQRGKKSGQASVTILKSGRPVSAIAWSPDGKTLAAVTKGGAEGVTSSLQLWDVEKGEAKSTLDQTSEDLFQLRTVVFSRDGKTLATSADGAHLNKPNVISGVVKLWNAETGRLKLTLEHDFHLVCVALSPDVKRVAAASLDKTVLIWNAEGTLERTLSTQQTNPWSVAFSPDAKTLAVGGGKVDGSGEVMLWDTESWTLKHTLKQEKHVSTVAFSPDGTMVASGGHGELVQLWDTKKGELVISLQGPDTVCQRVTFSPDGRTVAAAARDWKVRLWEVKTGTLKETLKGHTSQVWSVAFSPDGKTLASASLDKTIRMWKLNGTEKAEEQGKGTDRSHELLRLSTGEKVIVTKQYADWLHQLSSLLEKLKLSAMARGR